MCKKRMIDICVRKVCPKELTLLLRVNFELRSIMKPSAMQALTMITARSSHFLIKFSSSIHLEMIHLG